MLEKEKSRRIVDELLTYFFSHDIDQVSLELAFSDDGFLAKIQGDCEEIPDDIYDFLEMLNVPRDMNLENYYDELLGGHQSLHEEKDYNLLGMMIDSADIVYEDNQLKMDIFRKKY
ncbi:hypothetical protein [Enterococcus olivae]